MSKLRKIFAIAALLAGPASVLAAPTPMTVYRSPSCGCCGKWMAQMKQQGFDIKEIATDDMDAIKKKHGIPRELQSCHTALVGDYVVEGHVPAADIHDLLKRHPPSVGLTVPGMPVGSPGMEMGDRHDPYSVLEFDKQGNAVPVHQYKAN